MMRFLKIGRDPASHYDDISDAWRYIFGDNFHFGYFTSPDISLDQATEALIDALADLGTITEQSKVLDIGCGIGAPAFHLYQKYQCTIVGISTSPHGVEIAAAASQQKGFANKVSFVRADGTCTGFEPRSFDVAWVLEASHLMDKKKLFSESHRVLKSGGQLLLCDIMLTQRPKILEQTKHLWRLKKSYVTGYLAMKEAFARGRLAPFCDYYTGLANAGFNAIEIVDISQKVLPTMSHWGSNITGKRSEILRTLSQEKLDVFLSASDFLEYLFLSRVMGYGLVRATKA
jgi:27-O-demethylrifamycin SV methyltransferase